MASYRPLVSVFSHEEEGKVVNNIVLPNVFMTPLRPDLVQFVHKNLVKNSQQPYAAAPDAGYQSSAESWGTGRAVSRLPRVPGGGTHRAGQAAFANMCRGGGMFAPTKIWRRWHRRVNLTMRRHAVCSAIAATGLTSLVLARGHRLSNVPELPLVVEDNFQSYLKTKKAKMMLSQVGCAEDLEKAKDSKTIRSGKGKRRGRKYRMRRGPLIVFNEDSGCTKAFRNIPGIELCDVKKLDLLQLAPGGTLGRLVVWSASAFKFLSELYGSIKGSKTSEHKPGYRFHRPVMTNPDLSRLINSDEIQNVVQPMKKPPRMAPRNKNPLKNFMVMCRLNPAYNKLKVKRILEQTPGTGPHKRAVARKMINKKAKADHQKKVKGYQKKIKRAFDDKGRIEVAKKEENRIKELALLHAARGDE